jgi:glutaredoxin
MSICDKYNRKIEKYKNEDKFIVFFKEGCPYSIKALELLKDKEIYIKGYKIDPKHKEHMFGCLEEQKDITKYDPSHKTFPTIFYKGSFIGGYTDLLNFLNR